MSGNGSVVSSSGDSALEGDRECVQGWFRALCLSNTSRTPPWSGLSDKRKGIYEASRCQARSTRLVHIDTAAWRPQEGPPAARGRLRVEASSAPADHDHRARLLMIGPGLRPGEVELIEDVRAR
jgi:hypothetical protein